VAFSPDGKFLVADGHFTDERLKGAGVPLWDLTTHEEIRRIPCSSWGTSRYLAFAENGKLLVTGEHTVELATGQGRPHPGRCVSLAPDGKTLAFLSWDNYIAFQDLTTNRIERTSSGFFQTVAFSADGKRIVTYSGRNRGELNSVPFGKIEAWDAVTGKEAPLPESRPVPSSCYSPDGKLRAVLRDRQIVLEDPTNRRVMRQWAHPALQPGERIGGGWSFAIFSPDGKTLLSSNGGNPLYLWDVATAAKLHELGQTPQPFERGRMQVSAAAFSPDGTVLAMACSLPPILAGFRVHNAPNSGTTFNAYHAGPPTQFIRFWDPATGKVIGEFKGPKHPVGCLAFSADGTILAAGPSLLGSTPEPEKRHIFLYEAGCGRLIHELPGHRGGVTSLAFSPDNRLLVSAGMEDPTGSVWDIARVVPAQRPSLTQWRKPVDEQRIQQLVADLDADQFARREQATRQLQELGATAEPALRKALAAKPALELRRRIDMLLDKVDPYSYLDTEENLKGLAQLERMAAAAPAFNSNEPNDPAGARKCLEVLAKGPLRARLTLEAQAALQRLKPAESTR
jgi:WD40 repeat protein